MSLSEINANISNGTCYFGQHSETNGDFIPCGNIALGNWPCCRTGDVCLAFQTANACYDYDSGNTYVAGCTDESYGDSTCPQKLGFVDQEWVAIHHCDTTSNGDTNWGGCKNVPANDTALTKIPNSMCDPYCTLSVPLFVGAASIEAFATVPSSAGGSITWTSDFNPTATSRPAGTIVVATTTPTTTSTTAMPTSTLSSPTPTPTVSNNGLNTAAKVGISIGSVGAAFLILAVALLALLVRRRRKRQQTQGGLHQQPGDGAQHPADTVGYDEHLQFAGGKPGQNFDVPYTGFKHELPADSPHVAATSPHGSAASPDHMSVSNESTLMSGRGGSLGHVSPQSSGPETFSGSYGRGESGPVSEMH